MRGGGNQDTLALNIMVKIIKNANGCNNDNNKFSIDNNKSCNSYNNDDNFPVYQNEEGEFNAKRQFR